MNVLVVDDDETIRVLLTHLFARRGDRVATARDGADAIARLSEEPFDLLVLDLMMPRVDGVGVLAWLRDRPAPKPRVIMMTAASPSLAAAVPREQIAAMISKPFEISTLLRLAAE
jgi:CheY-like chemotaxis protein